MIIHDYGTDTSSPSPDPNPPSNPNFNGMLNQRAISQNNGQFTINLE